MVFLTWIIELFSSVTPPECQSLLWKDDSLHLHLEKKDDIGADPALLFSLKSKLKKKDIKVPARHIVFVYSVQILIWEIINFLLPTSQIVAFWLSFKDNKRSKYQHRILVIWRLTVKDLSFQRLLHIRYAKTSINLNFT